MSLHQSINPPIHQSINPLIHFKKRIASLLLALVWLALLTPAPHLPAQESPAPQTKHCLWKIQGQTNAVFLFGSIHFLKKDFYPLDPPIEAAYRQSQMVVFETDLEEMLSPKTQVKMLQMGSCPAGETIQKQVAGETYAALTNDLRRLGLPLAMMDPFKPWMAAILLVGIELQKLGFEPDQGVDKYFHTKAQRDHKSLAGLETLEFQLGLFNSFSRAESEAMLLESLTEISRFKGTLLDLTAAWKSGDTQKIEGLMLENLRKFPQVYKKLMLERNVTWAGKISELLTQGKNAFVVVGAGHLAGKDSVVALLEKKGFRIEQQ